MSLVKTLPSRLALSHVMICGGTKPTTPILTVCFAPAVSVKLAVQDHERLEERLRLRLSVPTNTFEVT